MLYSKETSAKDLYLVLKLFLQIEEYLKGNKNGYGTRRVIHQPDTLPFPHDEGIFIPAAMETSIGLKLVYVNFLQETSCFSLLFFLIAQHFFDLKKSHKVFIFLHS